jgi:hypothetical protein
MRDGPESEVLPARFVLADRDGGTAAMNRR